MPLRIKCPNGHPLTVPSKSAGKWVKCPACAARTQIPSLERVQAARQRAAQLAREEENEPAESSHAQAPLPRLAGPAESGVLSTKYEVPSTKYEVPRTKYEVPIAPPIAEPPPAPPVSVPSTKFEVPIAPPIVEPPPAPPVSVPGTKLEVPVAPPIVEPPPAPPVSVPGTKLEVPAAPPVVPNSPPPVAAPPVSVPSTSYSVPSPPIPEPPVVPGSEFRDPSSDEEFALPGEEHKLEHLLPVYYVAGALALLAVFSMAPGVVELVDYWRARANLQNTPDVGFWAWLILFLGVVQLAYAVLLAQVPDWSTTWIVSMLSLAMATLYAAALAVMMLAGEGNGLVDWLELAYLQRTHGLLAAQWCLCILSLSGMLAWFSGALSLQWKRAAASGL